MRGMNPRLGQLPREAAGGVVSDDRWPSRGFTPRTREAMAVSFSVRRGPYRGNASGNPPSTVRMSPVVYRNRSLASNTARSATASAGISDAPITFRWR